MPVHLVRHARAGERHLNDDPDELRPLSAKGSKQAIALAERFALMPVTRVLSSHYLRCRQTVEPLADRLGMNVEEHPALQETADLEDIWSLVEALLNEPGDIVVCTHGNLIGPVIDRLHRRGLVINDRACEKASTWSITPDDRGEFAEAVYTPPA